MTQTDDGQQLINLVEKGTTEDLFNFLQKFHRKPFVNVNEALVYQGVIDDQIDFIDTPASKYQIGPLIISVGKGSFEKTKLLLVHGANPNKQCATGDTALNFAAHRQKCLIVDLLLQYRANPNIQNQAGKTALHRAVVSYNDENAKHIRALLLAGADTRIEDRNGRTPLDEATFNNRCEALHVLLSHDRTLVERAYRAAVIAARFGHDKCLEILLNYGMDPNISDESNTSPLHVAVRSLKPTIIRLLISTGADPNKVNRQGETPMSIAQDLPSHEREPLLNILNAQTTIMSKDENPSFSFLNEDLSTLQDAISIASASDFHQQLPEMDRNGTGRALQSSFLPENGMPEVYPLLRNQPNWTLDDPKHRSTTARHSSVENLLDPSTDTYWCSTQSKDAWVVFDLKHEHDLNGIRVVASNDRSMPKDCQLEVSNSVAGPWCPIIKFTCSASDKNDFFFPTVPTRFIRLWIFDNYGGDSIRIQSVEFYGVDSRLVDLLREYGLEKILPKLFANHINDLETLHESREEILNIPDAYVHLNDHFRLLNLTSALRIPQLTFLSWFDPPQSTVLAGQIFPTFSVIGNLGVTDRVLLEEQLENRPHVRAVMKRDLEPIQDYSLADFAGYTIKEPGRYRIRVLSVASPHIQTPWQEIVVGASLSTLTANVDEKLYLASTTHLSASVCTDKESNSLHQAKRNLKQPTTVTTAFAKNRQRTLISHVYESDIEDTEDESYLVSLKSIEESPYSFAPPTMLRASEPRPNHTTAEADYDRRHQSSESESDSDYDSNDDDELPHGRCLTPTKYRNNPSATFPERHQRLPEESRRSFKETVITPTKYKHGQTFPKTNHDADDDDDDDQGRRRPPDDPEYRDEPISRKESHHNGHYHQKTSPREHDRTATVPQTPSGKRPPDTTINSQNQTEYRGTEQFSPPRDTRVSPTAETKTPPKTSEKPQRKSHTLKANIEFIPVSSDNESDDDPTHSPKMKLVFKAKLTGAEFRQLVEQNYPQNRTSPRTPPPRSNTDSDDDRSPARPPSRGNLSRKNSNPVRQTSPSRPWRLPRDEDSDLDQSPPGSQRKRESDKARSQKSGGHLAPDGVRDTRRTNGSEAARDPSHSAGKKDERKSTEDSRSDYPLAPSVSKTLHEEPTRDPKVYRFSEAQEGLNSDDDVECVVLSRPVHPRTAQQLDETGTYSTLPSLNPTFAAERDQTTSTGFHGQSTQNGSMHDQSSAGRRLLNMADASNSTTQSTVRTSGPPANEWMGRMGDNRPRTNSQLSSRQMSTSHQARPASPRTQTFDPMGRSRDAMAARSGRSYDDDDDDDRTSPAVVPKPSTTQQSRPYYDRLDEESDDDPSPPTKPSALTREPVMETDDDDQHDSDSDRHQTASPEYANPRLGSTQDYGIGSLVMRNPIQQVPNPDGRSEASSRPSNAPTRKPTNQDKEAEKKRKKEEEKREKERKKQQKKDEEERKKREKKDKKK